MSLEAVIPRAGGFWPRATIVFLVRLVVDLCKKKPLIWAQDLGYSETTALNDMSTKARRLASTAQTMTVRDPVGSGEPKVIEAQTDLELIEAWSALYDGPKSRANQRVGLRFLNVLGVPLQQAAPDDFRRAAQSFASKPDGTEANRSTRASYAAAIKSFVCFAHTTSYLAMNATPLIQVAKRARDLAKRSISEVDARLLMRAAKPGRNRLLIEVAYRGKLRLKDVVNLTWADLTEPEGDRFRPKFSDCGGDKTCEVLLPLSLAQRLIAYRNDDASDAPIFPEEENGKNQHKHLSEKAAFKIVRNAAARAGLTKSEIICPHWLRYPPWV